MKNITLLDLERLHNFYEKRLKSLQADLWEIDAVIASNEFPLSSSRVESLFYKNHFPTEEELKPILERNQCWLCDGEDFYGKPFTDVIWASSEEDAHKQVLGDRFLIESTLSHNISKEDEVRSFEAHLHSLYPFIF